MRDRPAVSKVTIYFATVIIFQRLCIYFSRHAANINAPDETAIRVTDMQT